LIIPANSFFGEDFPLSIYIHIPFCRSRCYYCDYISNAGYEAFIPKYVNSLINEIYQFSKTAHKKLTVHSIFFGGGTPSLLTPKQVEAILTTIFSHFTILNSIEITLEANPNSLQYEEELMCVGINRISIGVQSTHQTELALLGRTHTYADVQKLFPRLRKVGFSNVNLDLIYGIPQQTLTHWKETLHSMLLLSPEHVSMYALTLETDTILFKQIQNGNLTQIDDDLAAEMYETGGAFLLEQGFEQYEISNWAKKDVQGIVHDCKHNMQYWLNLPYVGFGVAAHGFINGMRLRNTEDLLQYIHLCTSDAKPLYPFTQATVEVNEISRKEQMNETMLMGLRLTQRGVREEEFYHRFGCSMMEIYGKKIDRLIALELIEWYTSPSKGLRLTYKGRLLGNQVFIQFV